MDLNIQKMPNCPPSPIVVKYMKLNGEWLEEVDCFKYVGSQVAADRGCERDVEHRMNEGYKA